MLELLVAITIAALLLTLVAPRLTDTVAHAELKASAYRVVAALREARWDAIKTSQPGDFVIDTAGRSYTVFGKTTTLPSGQTIVLSQYNQSGLDQETQIEFLPDGSSSGGTIAIAEGVDRIRIDIDWLSGRVISRD